MRKLIATISLLAAGAGPSAASTVYMLLGNGQSLSLGDTGCGAISITQSWGNQTYNGSALVPLVENKACSPSGAAYSSGATYQPYASVNSGGTYYETLSQTSAVIPASPWVTVTTQESPLSAAANNAVAQLGAAAMIAENFGTSGAAIASWCASSKVTAIQNAVSAIKTLVAPNTLVVLGALVTAGESDYSSSSTTYYSDSLNCQSAIETAVKGVTGQSQHVPFIYSQMSTMLAAGSPYGYTCPDGASQACIDSYPISGTSNHVPIAQYELARDYPALFYLTGPKYHLSYGTNVNYYHMDARGYNLLGAESARVLACLAAGGSCVGGVMPRTPIYVSGTTVTLNVSTPGGLNLDNPANAQSSTWSDGAIPAPYWNGASRSAGAGFQFFTSNGEIPITAASVSGTTITLTLASAPTGSNWQLAYGFEGMKYALMGAFGCTATAASCNGINASGTAYSQSSPHGNIRTVADYTDINGDAVYHWMPHFIENVVPQPATAVISGGACSGCRF